ncbi:MAG: Lrp/AsnC family transcriptional regulator [Nitrososphaerota archaeon]|nr:Lrp/AsnC family transcriptional regulator [Nitrososphaerota archaeon]
MSDGRKSVVEIAGELQVPRATVQERIRRMVETGVIRKFTAVPDYSKLGKQVSAYVLVSFRSDESISQRSLAQRIAKMPEVSEVSVISGQWDIVVKVRAESVEGVGGFVTEKLRAMRGIEKTETCVCFESVKEGV